MDMDDDTAAEFRDMKVMELPQTYFMVIRVISLFRGLISAQNCDISSAILWETIAVEELQKHGWEIPARISIEPQEIANGNGTAKQKKKSHYDSLKEVGELLVAHDFPFDRSYAMALAIKGLYSIDDIVDADEEKLKQVC